ncbi:hypothetical protein BJ166DRAFT_341008 [Pestalotiopsis sp. NC0098]|nr:hypothetical protein BJ166DRAFT_341008 [Pestalotiopsis sp. NC0098]
MDLDHMNLGDHMPITSSKLKRGGRGSSPACEESFASDLDQPQPQRQPRTSRDSLSSRMSRNNRQRKATQQSRTWILDGEDGVDLARSRCWLPSDGARKKPRLRRQEAFRVPEAVYTSDVVESDAELYRLGLLYDDEHVRGSGFNLNAIVHPSPVYPVRPARRARKSFNAQCSPGLEECDEYGSMVLGQLLASTLDVSATTPDRERAFAPYPTPASTPRHSGDMVGEEVQSSLASSEMLSTSKVPRSSRETGEGGAPSDSEGEDFIGDWDMLPRLSRESSDTNTLVEDIEIDPGVALEAWIVLEGT